MVAWTYEGTRKGYEKMWGSIKIKGGLDATHAATFAKKIIAERARYKTVEAATGVPWYFIGALHMRESGCDFAGVLHNGQKIIGTRKKTTLVPKGRGPFKTWEAAAIDALSMKESLWSGRVWNVGLMGFVSENFNGLGYVGKGVNSAYLWAGSNQEQLGKYVADHVWDKSFDDPQIGTMTVLKALAGMDPEIAAALKVPGMSIVKKAAITVAAAVPTGAAVNEATSDSSSTFDTLMPIVSMFQSYGTLIATVFTVTVIVGCVFWHFYEKSQAEPA